MKNIGVLIFQDFELLDVFGPLEFFGMFPKEFNIQLVAEKSGNVRSSQGPSVNVDTAVSIPNNIDMLLIPGGPRIRSQVNN